MAELICECGTELERKGSRGPLPSKCEACKKKRRDDAARRWRAENYERYRAAARIRSARYRESHRDELRASAREYMRARLEDPAFRESQRMYSARFRAANPERWQEIARRSRKKHAAKYAEHRDKAKAADIAHRRRARIRGLKHEKIDRWEVFSRDGGVCHFCGHTVDRENFHLDHLIPISHGGAHIYSNVAVSHPECNLKSNAGYLPAQLMLVG